VTRHVGGTRAGGRSIVAFRAVVRQQAGDRGPETTPPTSGIKTQR